MPYPLLKLESVSKIYPGHKRNAHFIALESVSLRIGKGKSLGLVGQSGAGKTTIARLITGLESPTSGKILLDGTDIKQCPKKKKKKLQIIWQDSPQYLNPYYSVEKLISEPLEIFKTGNKSFRRSRSIELLELTGLTSRFLKRKPHELSGGQCQRVAIARALSTGPELLICDEPFSGLDIPSRFDLMKLFARLSQESGLSYLMISHDISLVKCLCQQIAVLRKGRIVELGKSEKILSHPSDPHTKMLIESCRSRVDEDILTSGL